MKIHPYQPIHFSTIYDAYDISSRRKRTWDIRVYETTHPTTLGVLQIFDV